MTILKKLLVPVLCLLISSCANIEKISKQEAFPDIYKQPPKSLLIVPLINNTTAADAPGLYYTTLKKPLAELGYYVLPIQYTQQVLKEQGIINGDIAKKVPLIRYKEIFGADAVLFITVNAWDTNYAVVASTMVVSSKISLYSTESSSILWENNKTVSYQIGGQSSSPIALLVDIAVTAIKTAAMDYVPIANEVNRQALNTLPKGSYNPKFGKDGKETFYGVFIPLATDKENLMVKKFPDAKEGYTNIYLYRQSSGAPKEQGVRGDFWLDNECIGDTTTDSFFKITVKSDNQYLLKSNYNTKTVKIKKEKNRFFKQDIILDSSDIKFTFLSEVPEKEARNAIKGLNLGVKGICKEEK